MDVPRAYLVVFFAVLLLGAVSIHATIASPTQEAGGVKQVQTQDGVESSSNTITLQVWRDTDDDGERERVAWRNTHNLVTDQGLDFYQFQISNLTTGLPAVVGQNDAARYIGLTNDDTFTPSSASTTLSGEITSGGLSRNVCDSNTGGVIDLGVGNYSCWVEFTATQDFKGGIDGAGLFWNGTSSSNSLVAEGSIINTTVLSQDVITANWSEVSFS